MASGKKGKKTKGKTLALTDFLQDTGGSLPSQPIRKSTTSWADEVDEYDGVDTRKVVNVVLPTAPKASRDMDDIADKVPKDPPYIAYLSNLPYDVDEEDIAEFFGSLRIANMRIPKDERPGEPAKLKGFGYIEFEDRESLMGALVIPDTMLKSRRIRIEVAANAENDRRRGGRMDMNRSDREMADTSGDWRSSNRPDPPADDRRRGGDRGGGGGGSFTREGMRDSRDNREGGGFSRDRDSGFSRDRDFGRDRDSGFGRNRDREQDDRPGAWRDGDRTANRDDRRDGDRGFSRSNFRDSDRDRGRGFDDRDDRRGGDRDDRRGGGFGRRYDDRDDRNGGGMTRSGRTEDRSEKDQDEKANSSEPRQRPKLNLAPRTKPIETPVVDVKEAEKKKEEAEERRPAPVPAASIFGAAKPVDTAQRERQIEEKLLKEQEDRLRDGSKDGMDKSGDEGEKRSTERSRPITRRDSSGSQDSGARENKNLPPREKRSDDYRKSSQQRDRDHRSPPPDKSKTDKPEREEKRRERPEREMPKLKVADAPVFSDSNKFQFLQAEDDDVSE